MAPASLNLGGQPSRRAASSRNIAIMTVLGVIGGGFLLFRSQSPRKGEGLVKQDDEAARDGPAKLGRSNIVSKEDAKAMLGDPPRGAGNVPRGPRF